MTFPVSALRRRRAGAAWRGLDDQTIDGVRVIGAYSGLIVLAELIAATIGVIQGALIDAAIVPVLLGHFVVRPHAPYRRLLPILALVALLRVLSVAAVVPRLPIAWWYVLVGVPVLIGAVLAIRLIDEPVDRLALRITDPVLDAAVVALGVPAGLVGYVLLEPGRIMPNANLLGVVVGMAVLAVFGAFLEELIYRGLLQTVAIEALGFRRAGVVFAATMGAAMYLGSGSLGYTMLWWLLGLVYGAALIRGASLWSLTVSHAVLLWGMAFWWRVVLG